MALVQNTIFVNQGFGSHRGALFDPSRPYDNVDRAVEAWNRYRVGDFVIENKDKCKPLPPCVGTQVTPNTRIRIMLAPGVYLLQLPNYTNVDFVGNSTQPNSSDVALVFPIQPTASGAAATTTLHNVSFDNLWAVVDLSAVPASAATADTPGLDLQNDVRAHFTTRVTATNDPTFTQNLVAGTVAATTAAGTALAATLGGALGATLGGTRALGAGIDPPAPTTAQ